MDLTADLRELFRIIFKFGGYWVHVRNEERRRYEGGKQMTISFEKDLICFFVLKEKVEGICPWLKGHEFKMYYHIFETSPKQYMFIRSDLEVMKMIEKHHLIGKVEIVITLQEDRENVMSSQIKETTVVRDTMECYYSNLSSFQLSNNEFLIGEASDDVKFEVGSRFSNSLSFKQTLRSLAIKNSFCLKIKASDRTRVIAICSQRGCSWRIRASLCGDGQSFEVKNFISTHLCPGVNRAGNKLATSTWIAHEIQDVVKKQPNIPPKHIKNNLEMTYGLSLPYMKLWRSREQARSLIFGEVDDNYRWVPTLKAELIRRNPGSHITYVCNADNSFQRFFVSFKVCIDGFLAGCRHLVGVDACHLKSKYLGVLLAASSIDGNNGLFNLAFAAVESESKKTWLWFLENLSESFGREIYPLSFISDMEKGLGEAIKKVFPDAEHRVCVRHLWKNLKKTFRCPENQKVQSLIWSAANTYIKKEFDDKFDEIFRANPRIHSYLNSLPYKWARSTFSTEIKNSYNTNNMSESFNAWVGPSRDKPVVDLIDMIRGMIMEQRAERKIELNNWNGDFVPHIEEYIREVTTRKEPFIIKSSSPYYAEVEGVHERHEVDLQSRECTCRFWQMDGLPCIHAIAVIASKEHPLWHTYIDQCYHVIRYKMAYEGAISTLPGKKLWKKEDGVIVGIPKTIRPRGRPKKKRFKFFLENNNSKSKKTHKCGRCGLWGHHRSTCKNPLNQVCARNDEENQLSLNPDGDV